ncbi:energy-coupling factor transporter transmembrane protein EcfT [bacterium]|nr:energy-coupling factor transporter transmembrane protein EcfT [bacterium]
MSYLKDFTLGQYIPGESLIHRLDPRTKLLCVLALMLTVFVVSTIPWMAGIFLLSVILFPCAGIPFGTMAAYLRSFAWLYLITFVFHLVFHDGRVIFNIPVLPLAVTVEGFFAGTLFTIRIAVLINLSMLLMAVTTPQDLTDGLERMFAPLRFLKIPVSEGALIVSIALRFVPILMQEARQIRAAQLSRGADFDGPWLVRVRKTLPMLFPLFMGALQRADDLAVAMEARGYQSGSKRTRLIELKFRAVDLAAIVLFSCLTLTLLYVT